MELFHPAVRSWFEGRFPAGPTEPQAAGWPEIAAGRHTLIAAPTGSGKTLAAFLVCIDRIYRAHEAHCRNPGRARRPAARAAGRVRVAAQGAGRGHLAEPRGAAGRDRGHGRPDGPARPGHPGCGADRRHGRRGARRDAQEPAGLPGHHPGVAVPAGDRRTDPRDAGAGPPRSSWTRSTPSRATSGAPTWRSPWSGWSTWPRSRCSGSACPRPSAPSRPSPGCWSARAPAGRRRTGRRGARSWTPATAASSTWLSSCPATSPARSPRRSRWTRSWT